MKTQKNSIKLLSEIKCSGVLSNLISSKRLDATDILLALLCFSINKIIQAEETSNSYDIDSEKK